MKNRIKPGPMALALVAAGFLLACFCFSAPVAAASASSAPSSSPQAPTLTPEQQAYAKVRALCLKEVQQQKIPRSQSHTFIRGCFKENGITKGIAMPPPSPPAVGR
jgi:hypothetical protein